MPSSSNNAATRDLKAGIKVGLMGRNHQVYLQIITMISHLSARNALLGTRHKWRPNADVGRQE